MKSRAIAIAGLIVAGGFVTALYALLALQYRTGENLPEYSSLRKDPLGASAFYEALAGLPDFEAARNRLPLREWDARFKGTLILAGAWPAVPMNENAVARLEGFVAAGGRLVIAFRGGSAFSDTAPEEPEDESATDDEPVEPGDQDEQRGDGIQELLSVVFLDDRWGFSYSYDDTGVTIGGPEGYLVERSEYAPASLPDPLSWRGALSFEQWHESWAPVYVRGKDRAVVLERSWGRGAIVLASDSYLLSNEALRLERQTSYLSWLVGPHRYVIFDESHLGLEPRVGVMTLARRYGLLPVLAVFGIVYVLFIWRNATSLTPRRGPTDAPGEQRVEKGASEALASLLPRATKPAHLLRTCVEIWAQTAQWQGRHAAAAQNEVAAALAEIERESGGRPDPVTGYQRICTVLEERKPHS